MKNFRKIDLVYLWCDGSDEEWRKRKELAYKSFCGDRDESETFQATHPSRYINNDELKYSLRSVEKYANWINHIYIVTDNQVPAWLNTDNPKVTIISHDDILIPHAAPCYNSMALEHCIKNIPDLSEYFIIANDDMFLNKKIEPKDLFTEEGHVIYRYFEPLPDNQQNLYCYALRNSAKLIYDKFGKDFLCNPHHNFDGYRKSLVIDCYNIFKKEIDNCICSHFRNKKDILRTIYSNYACAMGKGYFKQIKKYDRDLPKVIRVIRKLLRKPYKESLYFGLQCENYEFDIKQYSPKFFCINDGEECSDADRARFKDFISTYFSEKSSYEKN